MTDFDKLVLVFYINIGNLDISDVEEYINRIKKIVVGDDTRINFFIPIRDGETRVECINPKLVHKEIFVEQVKNLVEAQATLLETIREITKNNS